jgi:DNA-directed RNA polymerase specialized sigma24 family protein
MILLLIGLEGMRYEDVAQICDIPSEPCARVQDAASSTPRAA